MSSDTAPTAAAAQPSPADRLRAARVGVRQDLDVSRHLFRGEPTYVIRDPLTFQSHRLDPRDYQISLRAWLASMATKI